MSKKTESIPVNQFIDDFNTGISFERIVFKDLPVLADLHQPERHDCHSFFLLEQGTISVEIDFQRFYLAPSTIIFIHPNQVHRILDYENAIASSWAIEDEHLKPEYLDFLEDITPTNPLLLNKEIFSIFSEMVSTALKLFERKNDRLYTSLLKDSSNALVALVISQYMEQGGTVVSNSRSEIVNKRFKKLLESSFTSVKRPNEYADRLNVSVSYLNECVKKSTGFSVSYN